MTAQNHIKSWGNDDEAYDETYEVIIFKIHSVQETFLEHENLSEHLETQRTIDRNSWRLPPQFLCRVTA